MIGQDLALALRLKGLVGDKSVNLMVPGEHPLALGFASLKKQLTGMHDLSVDEISSLAEVTAAAQLIFRYEDSWRLNATQLVNDLRKASECRAILFELNIMAFSIEPAVTAVEWKRYRSGELDIRTESPELAIECKLIRSSKQNQKLDEFTAVRLIRNQLRAARKQPRRAGVPFVIAVGFADLLSDLEVRCIRTALRQEAGWFLDRPEISGVLIVMPVKPPSEYLSSFGLSLLQYTRSEVTELVNRSATNPYPPGFRLRAGRPVDRRVRVRSRVGTEIDLG